MKTVLSLDENGDILPIEFTDWINVDSDTTVNSLTSNTNITSTNISSTNISSTNISSSVVTGNHVISNGNISVGQFLLKPGGGNDKWIRIYNANNSGYGGGLAASNLSSVDKVYAHQICDPGGGSSCVTVSSLVKMEKNLKCHNSHLKLYKNPNCQGNPDKVIPIGVHHHIASWDGGHTDWTGYFHLNNQHQNTVGLDNAIRCIKPSLPDSVEVRLWKDRTGQHLNSHATPWMTADSTRKTIREQDMNTKNSNIFRHVTGIEARCKAQIVV